MFTNEAFSYVVTSFEDLSFTEGDQILGDIFMALQQFEGTHIQLVDFFQDQVAVKDSMSQFSIILEQVNDLEKVWDNVEARQQLIREKLAPMYASWSNVIFQTLQPMTIS